MARGEKQGRRARVHELEAYVRDLGFRALAEDTPDVVARYDRALRYQYVNNAITRVTGLSPEFFLGKNIVHLPTVKCHIYTTTTGAMKNAFGGLLNTRRHYTHSYIHETLVDLLTIQKEIHSGLFAMKDGTTCGNGPGPRTMIPVEKDILMASGDQVAIDAVAAKIMGFDPMSIKYIRLAHEAGLGVGDPRDIEVVGEDITNWNFRFTVGDNAVSRFGDLVWFGPLHWAQKMLFRTPLVYFFVFGSFFYHDYAWYPTIGKRRIDQYKKTSKWMRLFEQYPEAVREEEKAA